MYEYLFFEAEICDHFLADLAQRDISAQRLDQELLIGVSEEITDEQSDYVDHLYEQLLQQTAELLERRGEGLEKDVAAVQVALADGSPCTIRLDSELMARLLSAISMEELRDMCQCIAVGVERRDNSPLCHVIES